jgi:AcrR family transcriptional regulator
MQRIEQKRETRRRVLASATEAIAERGLKTPSVNEVMGAAGLTVGGFYAHFENRDAMLLEALDSMLNGKLALWLEQLPDAAGRERRQLAARGYLSRKHRDGEFERCPLPKLLGELDRVDPRFRALVADHIEQWAAALIGSDECGSDDAKQRALGAIATMVGAMTLARALGPTEQSDQLLRAAKAAIA